MDGVLTKLGELETRHPVATGIVCAALIGYSAWLVYDIGGTIARVRMLQGLQAEAANAGLGG